MPTNFGLLFENPSEDVDQSMSKRLGTSFGKLLRGSVANIANEADWESKRARVREGQHDQAFEQGLQKGAQDIVNAQLEGAERAVGTQVKGLGLQQGQKFFGHPHAAQLIADKAQIISSYDSYTAVPQPNGIPKMVLKPEAKALIQQIDSMLAGVGGEQAPAKQVTEQTPQPTVQQPVTPTHQPSGIRALTESALPGVIGGVAGGLGYKGVMAGLSKVAPNLMTGSKLLARGAAGAVGIPLGMVAEEMSSRALEEADPDYAEAVARHPFLSTAGKALGGITGGLTSGAFRKLASAEAASRQALESTEKVAAKEATNPNVYGGFSKMMNPTTAPKPTTKSGLSRVAGGSSKPIPPGNRGRGVPAAPQSDLGSALSDAEQTLIRFGWKPSQIKKLSADELLEAARLARQP